jgi:hypothetical protein
MEPQRRGAKNRAAPPRLLAPPAPSHPPVSYGRSPFGTGSQMRLLHLLLLHRRLLHLLKLHLPLLHLKRLYLRLPHLLRLNLRMLHHLPLDQRLPHLRPVHLRPPHLPRKHAWSMRGMHEILHVAHAVNQSTGRSEPSHSEVPNPVVHKPRCS